MDDDEAEESLAEWLAQKEVHERLLTDLAVEHGWDLEVEVVQCEECKEDSINGGWSFGIGYIWADPDGFVVMYDPDTSNPDRDNTIMWHTREIEGVPLLVDMLLVRFPFP